MPATFLELRDRARQRADMVGDAFLPEVELKTFVNEARKALWDLIVGAYGDQLIAAAHAFSLSGSTSSLDVSALSPLIYKVRGVDRKSGGQWCRVHRFAWSERNRNDRYQYRLMGQVLHFTPEGNAAGDYRLWYIPRPADLSGDSDEIDAAEEPFAEFIPITAAIKMKDKDQDDTGILLLEQRQLIARIEAMSSTNDAAEPQPTNNIHEGDWHAEGWPV